jgi:hypothetical protein
LVQLLWARGGPTNYTGDTEAWARVSFAVESWLGGKVAQWRRLRQLAGLRWGSSESSSSMQAPVTTEESATLKSGQ